MDSINKALKNSEATAFVDVDNEVSQKFTPSNYTKGNYSINHGVYLIMNNDQEILKDIKVRRALQRGINTEEVRQTAGGGVQALGLPYVASLVPGSPEAPSFDPGDAEKQLDAAGWKMVDGTRMKDGKELKLRLKTISKPQYQRVSNDIANQLRKIGIKVEVFISDDKLRSASFIQSVLQSRDYDLLVYELALGADPDEYAYWHSSQKGVNGYNFANYSNATSDAALVSARDILEPGLRNAKYTTFAKQWLNDAPAVGLYQQSVSYIHTIKSNSISENTKYVSPADRFDNVANWSVNKREVYRTP